MSNNSHDFFKKFNTLFEGKECSEEKEVKKEEEKKDEKKKQPANVKENAADFFRKYSDIIKEAEETVTESDDEDEDPDVAKADKVKGKDGKTQADSEKNLPPWLKKNLDKSDKKAEDKGAKKFKKEKDLDEGVFGAQWNDKKDGWEQPKTPAARKNVADKLRAARKVGDNPRVDGGERGKAGDVTTVSVPANSNRQGRNTTGDFMPNNVRTGKVPPKGPNGRTRA
jgi:hypothetical protein